MAGKRGVSAAVDRLYIIFAVRIKKSGVTAGDDGVWGEGWGGGN